MTANEVEKLELTDTTGSTMDVDMSGHLVDIETCNYGATGIIADSVFLLSAESAALLIDHLGKWLRVRHGVLGYTERLLSLYGSEIGIETTLDQLIDSHRSQRAMVSQFSNGMINMRREEMKKAYAGYDLDRIAALREAVNDLLDEYIEDAAQAIASNTKPHSR